MADGETLFKERECHEYSRGNWRTGTNMEPQLQRKRKLCLRKYLSGTDPTGPTMVAGARNLCYGVLVVMTTSA